MPPTRGHDLKPTAAYDPSKKADAPHTGARLETFSQSWQAQAIHDAPHTGARLETSLKAQVIQRAAMPPTRGHDLKHQLRPACRGRQSGMPPTRGHDLKLAVACKKAKEPVSDAPHTGARLETSTKSTRLCRRSMPPTRGHDLKRYSYPSAYWRLGRCPPHGGTT